MAIIFILLAGLILRLINLNQSLWLDEAVQAITSAGPLREVFSELHGDFHPPLYHLFMWFWVHLFGNSEVILRLPSVLLGVATVYVVYLIAKEILPQKKLLVIRYRLSVSELCALMMATAPFHIYYSQEARPYALVVFLTCLSVLFLLRQNWLFFIISSTLAFYSSYYYSFVFVAQAVYLIRHRQFSLFRYLAIPLLFFSPWIPSLMTQISVGRQATSVLPEWGSLVSLSFWKAIPLTFLKFSIGRITIFNKAVYALVGALLGLVYGSVFLAGFIKKKIRLSPNQWLVILWLVIPLFSAWLISFFIPNYQPFRLLLVLPAFYLVLSWGVSGIKTTMIRIIVVTFVLMVNLVSVGVYFFDPYFHREDWRGAVSFIVSQKRSRAILPSQTSDWPWRYYATALPLISIKTGVGQIQSADLEKSGISGLKSNIYYIRYLVPLFDPQELVDSYLKEHQFVKIKEVSFNQIPVWVYQKR